MHSNHHHVPTDHKRRQLQYLPTFTGLKEHLLPRALAYRLRLRPCCRLSRVQRRKHRQAQPAHEVFEQRRRPAPCIGLGAFRPPPGTASACAGGGDGGGPTAAGFSRAGGRWGRGNRGVRGGERFRPSVAETYSSPEVRQKRKNKN